MRTVIHLLLRMISFVCLFGLQALGAQGAYNDPYEVLKLSIPRGKEFFDRAQNAARSGDSDGLASMVRYPLMVIDQDGKKHQILSRAQLLKKSNSVFDEKVRNAILCQSFETLMVSSNGVMLGNGTIWADVSSSGETLEIVTVNRRAARSISCAPELPK
ncbi:MAG: hypothetical protein QM750_20580 [Rubrivivax sp.]